MPAPLGRVFRFFSRPENLAQLTPPALGFHILTPSPIEMKPGALINYTIRLFGIRVGWTTLITQYEEGRAFVDEQLKGPYSFWQHFHNFEEVPGGTLVHDEVRYAMPYGLPGRIVHALVVKRQLNDIFEYRAKAVAHLLQSETEGIIS